jgi:hypothetical protein
MHKFIFTTWIFGITRHHFDVHICIVFPVSWYISSIRIRTEYMIEEVSDGQLAANNCLLLEGGRGRVTPAASVTSVQLTSLMSSSLVPEH